MSSALRKAAQQALDALENEFNPDWDQIEALQESLREHMAEIHRLRAALAEPQEPVEPVAWLSTDCIGERYLCFSKPLDNDPVQPLYTAPPQRKPLTDESIVAMWHQPVLALSALELARAIERAHKIF